MGWYFVTDITTRSARVSMIPLTPEEDKEETIFEGLWAELRATQYAAWMNEKGENGTFDSGPVGPTPKAPRTWIAVPVEGVQGFGDIPGTERDNEGCAKADVL